MLEQDCYEKKKCSLESCCILEKNKFIGESNITKPLKSHSKLHYGVVKKGMLIFFQGSIVAKAIEKIKAHFV